jgi:hypothetical protein
MTFASYFSDLNLGIAIGVLVAGIIAVATDHEKKGYLFHIGVLLSYSPICYLFGGGMFWLI